jgi:hypothetical protein
MAEPSLEINLHLAMTVVVMVMVVMRTGACRNNSTSQNNERNSSKKQGTQLHSELPLNQPLLRMACQYMQPIGSCPVLITYFVLFFATFRP